MRFRRNRLSFLALVAMIQRKSLQNRRQSRLSLLQNARQSLMRCSTWTRRLIFQEQARMGRWRLKLIEQGSRATSARLKTPIILTPPCATPWNRQALESITHITALKITELPSGCLKTKKKEARKRWSFLLLELIILCQWHTTYLITPCLQIRSDTDHFSTSKKDLRRAKKSRCLFIIFSVNGVSKISEKRRTFCKNYLFLIQTAQFIVDLHIFLSSSEQSIY